MHELAITKALLKSAGEACQDNNITNAKKVVVELGLFTTYKKEPLTHYFNALKPNSAPLREAQLIVIEIPGRIFCKKCKREQETNDPTQIFCKKCESFDVEIIGGNELNLKSITENEE